jgi:cobyrinic acid a,c-diamide synthase
MSTLYISAAHKSSGKTTVTLGLVAALRSRGLQVQPFKKGPDYIDPMWLGAAAGRPCYNLDFNTQDPDELLALFASRSAGSRVAVVEGNKGLYDGTARDGSNSNAALAKLLAAPVVLVLDCRGMTRGVAPLVLGFQAFDPAVRIAGVILNQVGGARHEAKLREAIQDHTGLPVLGAVAHAEALVITERHLGLVPSNEHRRAAEVVGRVERQVAAQLDLDAVLAVSDSAPALPSVTTPVRPQPTGGPVRIAIARDAAFGFYYPDDLDALEQAGAELVPIDTLTDRRLPRVDGLFLGGGFPETHMVALEANADLRAAIAAAIDSGLPAYAECGGLMYLARTLRWGDRRHQMVGALPFDVVMEDRPQGRGYVRLAETGLGPWPDVDGRTGTELSAHEFHYSRVERVPPGLRYAYRVLRGSGVDGAHDGIVHRNLLASYAHLRDVRASRWASRFVAFVRAKRQEAREAARPGDAGARPGAPPVPATGVGGRGPGPGGE